MITATNTGFKRELIPAGSYIARCYSMVHIGTVEELVMGEPKLLNKVRITWELPNELKVFNEEKGEQPLVISQEYTLSMHEKSNLRKMLESWRGKGFSEDEAKSFDITKLLGRPCMLNIIHRESKTGSEYEVISGISMIPKGVECPAQINPIFEFNYEDKFNAIALEGFPDFIKDRIKKSNEYKRLLMPESNDIPNSEPEHEIADDLPF